MTKSILHAKLAKIQGQLGVISKSGFNAHQKYSFVTEQSFLDALRPLTSAEGITLVVSSTFNSYQVVEKDAGKFNHIAVVNVTLTITDSESGESIQAHSVGVGHDAGDKAIYKAMTGGAKYAYWKAFALATGDDPENDGDTPKRTMTRKTAQKGDSLI